jgi:hypothetical protein
MAVGIPLPELDLPKPAQNPAPDALAEFQRAAQLKTAAAQQQAISAQTQGQEQQNQMQAMQLKDEQLRRSLAPKFVQKDDSGKVTGFDNEGLYSAMLSQGADPVNIQKMRMSQIEMQKSLMGLDEQRRKQVDSLHSDIQDALETVQKAHEQESKSASQASATVATPAVPAPSAQPNIPPDIARPQAPAAPPAIQDIGSAATGSPESLGVPPSGTVATPSESSIQTATENAPRPVGPTTQAVYQKQLMNLAQKWGPQAVAGMKPMLGDARDIEQAEAEVGSIKEAQSNADKAADIAKKSGEGVKAQAEAEASQWKPAGEGTLVNFKTGQIIHGVASPDVEAFKAYVAKGGDPAGYPAYKAQQEAAATQPYKIQTAEAEGKARQLIQGLGESVYAFKPNGTHELMSKTAALQTPGITAMVPATEKQIGDDILLNNRLSDVQQKINNYDQALAKIGSTVSDKDQGNIAALIGKGGLKIGAFGTELPTDRLNAALQKENISGLSDDAIKLLAAYYNARESLVGYNRVLSGSARGGEKQMELSLDTLPNPGTTDPRYAKEGMKQFRQNLQVVGQGLPVIPGIKRPDEWSPNPNSSSTAPPANDFFSQFGGKKH